MRAQRRPYRAEWVQLALALLVIGSLLAYTVLKDRQNIESQEGDRLQVQARVIDENIAEALRGVGNALVGIREDFARADAKNLNLMASRRMKAMTDALPGMRSVCYLDADGNVLAAGRPELIGQNLAQREFFTAPRAHPDPETLYISSPFKSADGVFVVNATKVLLGPSGEFAGVVTASLDPDYFNVVLRSVLYAPDMRTTTVHADGTVFVNMPVNAAVLGTNVAKQGSFFTRHRDSGKAATIFTGNVLASGEDRTVATRTITSGQLRLDKPLVIHVSREYSAMYGPWRRQAFLWASIFALLAFGAIATLFVSQRRRRVVDAVLVQIARERAEGAKRLEIALTGADLGLWDWHRPSNQVKVDARMRRMLGLGPGEAAMPAADWHRLVHPDDAARVAMSARPHLRGHASAHRSEYRVRHNDGRWIWVLNNATAVERDEAGALVRMVGTFMDITARKEAELQQTLSEKRLRAITDNIPALISHFDRDERCTFTNPYCGEVYGVDHRELVGISIRQAKGAREYEKVQPYIKEVLGGYPTSFENRTTINGQDRYLQQTYVPDLAGDGTVQGFYSVSFDVTERKRAELEHALSERRLRAITDSLPALISHFDREQRYLFGNAYFAELFHIDHRSILGRTLREFRGEDAYAQLGPHIAKALRGERVSFESSADIDGQERHFQQNYVPDVAPDGSVRGVFSVSFDITDRKQAEVQQARNEARMRSILDHAPDAFIEMDEHGLISEWNQRAESTFGWRRDEVLGRLLAEVIVPPRMRDLHTAGLRRFVRTGAGPVINNRIEVNALHRDGREIPVELSVGARRVGEVFVAVAFLHDITERKDAEARLAASAKRLRDITNNIPAIIGYFDSAERCEFANDLALKIHRIPRSALRTHTLRSALGDANYAQHEPHLPKVLAGNDVEFEGKVIFRGRDAFYRAHLIPDRADDGSIRGFYLMSFDVTALKEAERARAAGEQRLKAITDNLPVLISYMDRDEHLRFANETFREWMGIDPATVIGLPIAQVIGPILYGQRQGYLRQALAGERVHFDVESTARGVTRYLHNIYIPDLQPDGTIAGIYALSSDVTALKQVEHQLIELARIDSLTGLPNRRLFEEKLPEAMARSKRDGRAMALMLLDVDHFKSINDTHGHGAGDAVLKQFSERLLDCVRVTDTVARLAGDEFVIILEGLNTRDEAERVARKIGNALRPEFILGQLQIPVSSSIGVVFLHGEPATAKELVAKADDALYQAKRAGRNTFALSVW